MEPQNHARETPHPTPAGGGGRGGRGAERMTTYTNIVLAPTWQRMYVYIYIYFFFCMYVCMYVCVHVCMYVCISCLCAVRSAPPPRLTSWYPPKYTGFLRRLRSGLCSTERERGQGEGPLNSEARNPSRSTEKRDDHTDNHIYIYIYIHMYVYVCIYIYISVSLSLSESLSLFCALIF